ncbi:DUF2141 domain-containing protein [Carboxylicivirga sp. M1479]|uniref:DUF2141 domain-containing protein n=1 Tax=Carboxylicivirga sp. M1479 TaxID=2594476 RepID=UPI0011786DF8|nr:DUF2141 domain-containing protein [Carboxylicivirga sp. M1479]TRX71327.1 DUF2141 domain-containing protein [Carboxylicivirga sp. M1479]
MRYPCLKHLLLHLTCLLLLSFDGPITLTINITQLENSDGHILLQVTDAESNAVAESIQAIDNKTCTIVFDKLKPGNYSYKYFHDANGNKELDTNMIGIPKEGYGFSNNAKGTFGPPSFEKTVFTLQNDTTHNCVITYF